MTKKISRAALNIAAALSTEREKRLTALKAKINGVEELFSIVDGAISDLKKAQENGALRGLTPSGCNLCHSAMKEMCMLRTRLQIEQETLWGTYE